MKIVWHKHNLMISSSVVYGHPVRHSCEVPNEYFWGAPFSGQLLFLSIFFHSCFFFRAKLLLTNHTLRRGNSLKQLPFGTVTNRRYLQKRYFFEAESIAQHQLFQKSKILEKATFSEQQYYALPIFSGGLPF